MVVVSILPFTDRPSRGTPLEMGLQLSALRMRWQYHQKRRGEVDGGRDLELEARAGGNSPAFQQFSSSS